MLLKRPPAHASQRLLDEFERTGCSRAFDALVTLHRDEVYAICQRMLRDAQEAEDATQAVFLTLALQARGGNSIDCVPAWLRKVARHVSLDLIKARKRRKHHEDAARQRRPDVSEGGEAARAADTGELKDILARHLQELPDSYRTPVVLFYFGGMSLPQISRQLGVKPKALGVRLLRARRMLAERLSGNLPWFAVAATPVLLHEAVRSGALTPAGLDSAGLIGALQVANASAFRRIGLATLAIAVLTSSAGSASIYVVPGALRSIQQKLPTIRQWLAPSDVPTIRLESSVEPAAPETPTVRFPLSVPPRTVGVPPIDLPPVTVESLTPPPSAFAVSTPPAADQWHPVASTTPRPAALATEQIEQEPFPHLASRSSIHRDQLPTLSDASMPTDDLFASASTEGVYNDPFAAYPIDASTDFGAAVTMEGADAGSIAVPEPVVFPALLTAAYALLHRRRRDTEIPRL